MRQLKYRSTYYNIASFAFVRLTKKGVLLIRFINPNCKDLIIEGDNLREIQERICTGEEALIDLSKKDGPVEYEPEEGFFSKM